MHADATAHVSFVRKRGIRKKARGSSPLQTGSSNIPKCMFSMIEEKGIALFCFPVGKTQNVILREEFTGFEELDVVTAPRQAAVREVVFMGYSSKFY